MFGPSVAIRSPSRDDMVANYHHCLYRDPNHRWIDSAAVSFFQESHSVAAGRGVRAATVDIERYRFDNGDGAGFRLVSFRITHAAHGLPLMRLLSRNAE